MKPILVSVAWNDAWVDGDGAVSLDDVALSHHPKVITTLGWLLYEDEHGVSIANEYFDDVYRGRTFIPRAMIISIVSYQLTKSRSKKVQTHDQVSVSSISSVINKLNQRKRTPNKPTSLSNAPAGAGEGTVQDPDPS